MEDMVSYNSLPMVGRLVEDKFNFESNVGVDLSNVKNDSCFTIKKIIINSLIKIKH